MQNISMSSPYWAPRALFPLGNRSDRSQALFNVLVWTPPPSLNLYDSQHVFSYLSDLRLLRRRSNEPKRFIGFSGVYWQSCILQQVTTHPSIPSMCRRSSSDLWVMLNCKRPSREPVFGFCILGYKRAAATWWTPWKGLE